MYMTNTFQYISDLHLLENNITKDIIHIYIKPTAENLLVAGDIGDPFSTLYQTILIWFSQNFKNTYIIAGNHEYYSGKSINIVNKKIQELCDTLGNVYFINNSIKYLNNICIIGNVLWPDVDLKYTNQLIGNVNIFNKIKNDNKKITPLFIKKLFNQELNWLTTTIDRVSQIDSVKKIIVMTHYPPLMCFRKSKYKYDNLKTAYCNSLNSLLSNINKKVCMWLCGHTHFNYSIYYNNIYIVSNCIGYNDTINKYKNNKCKNNATYVL